MPEEEAERTYHVGYARAVQDGLFQGDIRTALLASWTPGVSITRYGRRWHLSRIVDQDAGFLFGRIGFVNEREVSTVFFDREKEDFVRGAAASGIVVPFSISTSTGAIAYQLRPGVVRESTFTGALEGLLNASPSVYRWFIEALVEAVDLDEWVSRVSRVTRFDVRLERPNPHYHGNEIAEEIIEGLSAEYARLTAKERSDEGIDTNNDVFQQAMDHVLRDYGRASLRGLEQDGGESIWIKLQGMVASATSRRHYRSFGPEEAPEDVLREALDQAPAEAAFVSLVETDDGSAQ